MSPISLTRITNGILILTGVLFFKPLAYFVAAMMIVAGLTGFCLLEKIFNRKVDLLTEKGISPYILPYIKNEVQWYEA